MFQERKSDFNEAVKLSPNLSEAFFNRGILKYEKGDIKAALADYSKSISLNRANIPALINRAILTGFDLEDPITAMEDLNYALSLEPNNASVLLNMGNIRLYSLNEPEKAYHNYLEALKYNPDSNEAKYNLSICLVKMRRFEEAKKEIERTISTISWAKEAFENDPDIIEYASEVFPENIPQKKFKGEINTPPPQTSNEAA
jgi:tetratricopeptide (TPR) repeat protein